MDLDKLQDEAEKLVALLKDRQRGLSAWNGFLVERLTSIVEMAADAGIRYRSGRD